MKFDISDLLNALLVSAGLQNGDHNSNQTVNGIVSSGSVGSGNENDASAKLLNLPIWELPAKLVPDCRSPCAITSVAGNQVCMCPTQLAGSHPPETMAALRATSVALQPRAEDDDKTATDLYDPAFRGNPKNPSIVANCRWPCVMNTNMVCMCPLIMPDPTQSMAAVAAAAAAASEVATEQTKDEL